MNYVMILGCYKTRLIIKYARTDIHIHIRKEFIKFNSNSALI